MSADQRIQELGLALPSGSAPAANYANAVRTGNLLFIAGKGPLPENGRLPKGRLGREFTIEDGYRFARSAALDLVAVMRAELGSLDRVARIVEVQGFLNAVPEFEDHARVLNGCSDLLVEIFRERGVHARSVLGASSLRVYPEGGCGGHAGVRPQRIGSTPLLRFLRTVWRRAHARWARPAPSSP